jgi:hypothetical protein
MFVGHYGVSFAIKGANKSVPLWLLFLAVQIICWSETERNKQGFNFPVFLVISTWALR